MLFSRHFSFYFDVGDDIHCLDVCFVRVRWCFFLFFVALPPILRPSRRVRVVINLTYTSSLLNNDE